MPTPDDHGIVVLMREPGILFDCEELAAVSNLFRFGCHNFALKDPLLNIARPFDALPVTADILIGLFPSRQMISMKDEATCAHGESVATFSRDLALRLGRGRNEAEAIHVASGFHDCGKILIPGAILKKAGPFTPEEWLVMQTHAELGARMSEGSSHPLLDVAGRIARWHHENFDGSGYPDGIRGPEIPIEARIVAVCDVCCALRVERHYKPQMLVSEVLGIMRSDHPRAGCQKYEPEILSEFSILIGSASEETL